MTHYDKKLNLYLDKAQQVFENDLIKENRRLNRLVNTYTVITLITLPFMLVNGAFGMNSPVPYQYKENTNDLLVFYIIMIGCSFLSILSILVIYIAGFF